MEKETLPNETVLLLVDKQGTLGRAIVNNLYNKQAGLKTVFLTNQNVSFESEQKEVLLIRYQKKIPLLPDALYSHVVIAYNGEREILDAIEAFIKKAEESKGKVILIVPLRLSETALHDFSEKKYKDLFVVYIGDVFDKTFFQKETTIHRFFLSAKNEQSIKVFGMGLDMTYPVLLQDVIEGIVKVIFSTKEKDRTFFLFQKHPPTKLSLARMFQKIDPVLRIDFIGTEEKDLKLPRDPGKFLLPEQYPLSKHIKNVYETIPEGKLPNFQEEREEIKSKTGVGRLKRFIFLLSYFLLIFLFLPLITTIIFSYAGVKHLERGRDSLQKGDFLQVRKQAEQAYALFTIANTVSEMVVAEAMLIRLPARASALQEDIERGQRVAQAILSFTESSQAFVKGEGINGSSYLRQTALLLQTLKMDTLPFKTEFFPRELFGVVDVIPEVFGFQSERVYLVLFQNNMELRPGGGFIGSYAIAKLEKGKISEFTIHDVYDADGQLKGHVEPPYPIRRHLPSVHWYLRDSNFNVDFPKNASSAAFFLREETGVSVDGVIATDVSFAKLLLEAIGPVEVSDYKETVTAKNLYTLTQQHAESDFFPGSSQKKDFLRSLFKAMQTRLLSGGNISYVKILEGIQRGIKGKHVLFAFADQSVQKAFTVNWLSSSLWDHRKKQEGAVNDFLGISEANLGVNKANYFVTRDVQQDIVFNKDGLLFGKLGIVYNNNGKEALVYKNYLRIILPLGTKLSAVTIDGVAQTIVPAVTDPTLYETKRFTKPQGLEIEQVSQDGKTIFGFLLVVPKGKQTTIVLSYELPKPEFINNNHLQYSLLFFKQPGTEEYPYAFSLSFPDSMKTISLSAGLSQKDGKVFLKKSISGDEQIDISLAKK